MESNVKTWAVLRQTAILHKNMLTDNMNDGLMFHTFCNTPLEWVTARDSGRLIANIIAKDTKVFFYDECERCRGIAQVWNFATVFDGKYE